MSSGKWRPSCLGLNVLTHKLSVCVYSWNWQLAVFTHHMLFFAVLSNMSDDKGGTMEI